MKLLRSWYAAAADDLMWLGPWLRRGPLVTAFVLPHPVRRWLLTLGGVRFEGPFSGLREAFIASPYLTVGRGAFINRRLYVQGRGRVAIGDGTAVGPDVAILTSHHERLSDGSISEAIDKPVAIGAQCWIGARVTILPGVTIGDLVMIAAGAVVTRDCLEPGMYGGVPARRLR